MEISRNQWMRVVHIVGALGRRYGVKGRSGIGCRILYSWSRALLGVIGKISWKSNVRLGTASIYVQIPSQHFSLRTQIWPSNDLAISSSYSLTISTKPEIVSTLLLSSKGEGYTTRGRGRERGAKNLGTSTQVLLNEMTTHKAFSRTRAF